MANILNIIVCSLFAGFITSCCCTDSKDSRSLFDIQYNDTYQGQFRIDGVYINENYSSDDISYIIFYSNGMAYRPWNFTSNEEDIRILLEGGNFYSQVLENEVEVAKRSHWNFYRVTDDMIEYDIPEAYDSGCRGSDSRRLEYLIINDSTIELSKAIGIDISKRYNFHQLNNKPDSIDFWRDK